MAIRITGAAMALETGNRVVATARFGDTPRLTPWRADGLDSPFPARLPPASRRLQSRWSPG